MNRNKRPPRNGGFTLVEVMFAAVVMALAIVGMIQALVSGSEMLDLSRKQTIAAQIIHGQIDHVRLKNWTEISAWAASATAEVDASNQSTNTAAGFEFGAQIPAISKEFTCTRTISTVRTDLKKLTYTVTWRGNTGRTYSRSGSTYVGRNGLYVTYQRS
ncbi:MAG: prepilin-type N-terminal cleavage/methylation domain-containing protein [Opitutaceae bacterium]|nr:prepilin-type N-terminal cleavage/methylation domain-containing protein [Opitutaceae bacterium]